MNRPPMLFIISAFLLALSGGALSGFARAQPHAPLRLDPQRVSWEHLRYQSKNMMVTLTAEMKLQALPAVQAEAVFLKNPRGTPLKASGPEVLHIALDMMIDFIFRAPVIITNEVWFNPDDAAALGRFRLRRGEDDFEKTYRFTEQGVFRRNREPRTREEAALDPDQWSRLIDTFYSHDLDQLGCPVVTERLVLIYILSAIENLKDHQPFSLCVFGKRQLHRVELKPEGSQTLKVDFVEKQPQAETRRQGEVQAIKIALKAEPMVSDLDKPENFSLLGLHKNIVIFIDPKTRLPIQITGDITTIGKATLKLLEVQYR
ncbi:MAG: hypothetical protein JJV98_12555 [Desulfosarcina sp.]|nr:hypothetical protein [Desulfobacterales bacterium]